MAPRAEWLLDDADLDDEWLELGDLEFDLCDVPRDKFIVAGEAWLALRSGVAPERSFGEDPELFGLEYGRAQLREDELSLLDELARLSAPPHEDGRLAELVASAPAVAPPREIELDDDAAARFILDVPDLWRRE